MPRRTSSPTPARAARASTPRIARCATSSRPPPSGAGPCCSVSMSPPARRRIPSTGRVRRTHSLDRTPTPELLPRSPSDVAIRARRPHVNRSVRRPVIWSAPDQGPLTHVYGERMNSKVLYPTLVVAWLVAAGFTTAPPADGDIGGSVADSATGTPLPGGEVRIVRGGNTIAATTTDAFRRHVIHHVPAGSYRVEVRYLGYRSDTQSVSIGVADALARADFHLVSLPINLSAVEVTSAVPLTVDTRTGNQIFKQNDYHGAPTNTTSQILQQSIVGAARAPTGEVHIRGQHAEYTYYVDGIPVPAGISGSLNELFDPEVVNQIDFQTGGWDAEYGNKNTAIVNVNTRIPTGGFHLDASGYGGSFHANGQALNASTNAGKGGFFFSGARQENDMRRQRVVFDTAGNRVENFHNHGEDLFGFGKIQYVPSDRDVVNLDVNRSRTRFAVPFDSVEGVIDDHQQDVNGFVNLGWRHRFDTGIAAEAGRSSELFAAGFFRDGSLAYTPGLSDDPTFVFFPDTTHYILSEDRNFHTEGLKLDYTLQPHHGLEFKAGALASYTGRQENFACASKAGSPGPTAY